jgi:hypothetical protein
MKSLDDRCCDTLLANSDAVLGVYSLSNRDFRRERLEGAESFSQALDAESLELILQEFAVA